MDVKTNLPPHIVPLTALFRALNSFEEIEDVIPENWGLKSGDVIEYDTGNNTFGKFEVLSIDAYTIDCIGYPNPEIVPGHLCKFKKIS